MNSWVLQGRHQLFKRNTDSVSMVLSGIIRFRFVLFMSVPTFKVTKFTLLHLTIPEFFLPSFPFLAILALYFLGPPFNNYNYVSV